MFDLNMVPTFLFCNTNDIGTMMYGIGVSNLKLIKL